jgi:hypothetical protein
MRKVILYIIYGTDQGYYDGAKFSILTYKYWTKNEDIEIVVLTEKLEEFYGYNVTLISLPKIKKNEWSLNGKYHFRIKNRGLAYVMDQLKLKGEDKILFFDADTYFDKSPIPLFDLINPTQAIFYLNEGLIHKRKRFQVYVQNLKGKKVKVGENFYELSKNSCLWGSLMVGIMPNMRPSLEWADLLMLKLYELVPSHTIEPFSLSEALLREYTLVEGKNFVSLYSTSRKKQYANKILSNFFIESNFLSLDEKISLAQKVKIQRPLFVIIKQRFLQIFNK